MTLQSDEVLDDATHRCCPACLRRVSVPVMPGHAPEVLALYTKWPCTNRRCLAHASVQPTDRLFWAWLSRL